MKFCSSCDEGFAERFAFCPNCSNPLQAFEMNPVPNETESANERAFEDDENFDEEYILVDEERFDDERPYDVESLDDEQSGRSRSYSDDEGPWSLASQAVKGLFYFVGGIGGLVLVILIFAKGVIWYQDYAYPVVSVVTSLPIFFLFPSGLVLGIFRKTRGLGGLFLVISSVLYLAGCWSQSLAFAYVYAGKVWMLIGFFLAGVGVFAMAFIGALVQGEYMDGVMIVISIVIFFVVHFGGFWMVASRDSYLAENR